jgi:hypothetical protein
MNARKSQGSSQGQKEKNVASKRLTTKLVLNQPNNMETWLAWSKALVTSMASSMVA